MKSILFMFYTNYILVFSLQWSDSSELTTIGKIKEGIMKLLIQCLPAAGVNLAHYLLGFNLKNIKRTILQSPGMYVRWKRNRKLYFAPIICCKCLKLAFDDAL